MKRCRSCTALVLLVVVPLVSPGKVLSQEQRTGKPKATLTGDGNGVVQCLAFSPDNASLAVARSGSLVEIWDLSTGQVTHNLHGRDWAREVAFSPDGRLLAVAGSDNTVRVWDIAQEKETVRAHWRTQPAGLFDGHQADVYTVAFDPDGEYMATGSQDQTARIWESATGQQKLVFNVNAKKPDEGGFILGGRVSSIAFSPDGKRIACASCLCGLGVAQDKSCVRNFEIGHVKVWEMATGKELVSIEAAADLVQFDTQGKRIASSAGNGLTIRDATTGKPIFSFVSLDGGEFRCIAFTQEGGCVAVLCDGKAAKVFEVTSTTTELLTVSGERIATLSHDGHLLASSPDGMKVEIWDIPCSGRKK